MASSLFDELRWRGFIAQTTSPDVAALLAAKGVRCYVGFDPSARSLHLGSLIPVMALSHLQKAGHAPIVLIGGATGMIGDPSGKSSERNLLTAELVAEYSECIRRQLGKFFSFEGENAALMVNNADWTSTFSYLGWLRDVGKYFSVKDMLEKDSVRRRLEGEKTMSYTEFSYMLLQANDFLHLHDAHGCTLQVGGDDQWGNITIGIDFVRKMRGKEVFGMTFPLLTTATGEKFGKTAKGTNVWLDPILTTPYRFYQHFYNADDKDVVRFLKLFTRLGREEIVALEVATAKAPEERRAQKALAREVTTLVHDAAQADAVAKASEVIFSEEIRGISEKLFEDVFADAHTVVFPTEGLAAGVAVVDVLARSGLAKSKGEARRLVEQGGVYLNNAKVAGPDRKVAAADLLFGRYLLVRKGKKDVCLAKFAPA
ncbi:MAG: tyrosine--tRNA ligase [Elusimicrobia bacterium]|nr:tyrosine--tRNA ligase [Elusimicrobiota bacterium]